MNGTLIPEIFALNLDIRLDLSYNDFTGPIPTEVGNMINLTSFTVNGNAGINGELPEEMSGMTQLAEIRINDTDMTGPIPDSVCTALNGSDPSPTGFADCDDHDNGAPCFQWCCTNSDCTCRYGLGSLICF